MEKISMTSPTHPEAHFLVRSSTSLSLSIYVVSVLALISIYPFLFLYNFLFVVEIEALSLIDLIRVLWVVN